MIRAVKPLIPAVAYYRMSTDQQDESIPRQRENVQTFAAENGYEIIREYSDHGISGFVREAREGFQRLVDDAERLKDFEAVLVEDQDRFSRFTPRLLIYYCVRLEDVGVRVVTIQQGTLNLDDFGEFVKTSANQLGKERFLWDNARKITSGMVRNAQAGKHNGAPPPYGARWTTDGKLESRPDEFPTLLWMFEKYDGEAISICGIAKDLNGRGILSRKGRPWAAETVRGILTNKRYIGTRGWGGRNSGKFYRVRDGAMVEAGAKATPTELSTAIEAAGCWEPIIEPALFERVQGKVKSSYRTRGEVKHLFVLTGLLRCPSCGSTMCGHSGTGYIRYFCNRSRRGQCKSNANVREDIVLPMVLGFIRDRLTSGEVERIRQAIMATLTAKQAKGSNNAKQTEKALGEAQRRAGRLRTRLAEDVPANVAKALCEDLDAALKQCDQLAGELAESKVTAAPTFDVKTKADQAIAKLTEIEQRLASASPRVLRAALLEIVENIDLRFEVEPWGKYKRHRFLGGTIYLRDMFPYVSRPLPALLERKSKFTMPSNQPAAIAV